MTSTRLKLSQEGMLWKIALEHLGPVGLHQVVVELWPTARPPSPGTVENLHRDHLGDDVLSILRTAQVAVGAVVPYRVVEPKQLAIYSTHAEALAYGLLKALPVRILSPMLKGARLEGDLGM